MKDNGVPGCYVQDALRDSTVEHGIAKVRNSVLSAIMSTALDAVIIIDQDGLVIGWSELASRLFGYSEKEALGHQIADLVIPDESRARHLHSMDRHVNYGETHILGKRVRMSAKHKDGSEFQVELAIMTGSDLGIKYFVGFVRDLTDELVATEKIENLTSEIFHVSRLNAMGTAASMIAHELSQPLFAAANYLAVCKQTAEAVQVPNDTNLMFGIQGAQDAISRASEVVRSVRDVVAKQPHVNTSHSLEELIHGSMRLLVNWTSLDPLIHLEADATFVCVNKGQIAQVILNLLKNAAEATIGKPEPIICCLSRKTGQFVEVCIRDNGIGLSEEVRDDLFQPFKSTKADGLGIGLSICRSIIDNHNGRIWAESDGSGTAFYFTVPSAE